MGDRRIKRKNQNNQSVNMYDNGMNNNSMNNNNMNNNMNSNIYNNMNNGSFNNMNNNSFGNMNNNNNMNNNMNNFNNQNNNMNNNMNNFNNQNNNMSNNMNNNMNNGFNNQNNMNNNMNNQNNMNNSQANNTLNNGMSNINTHTGYQEKQYQTGELEKNTVLAKSTKISKVFLVGFYLIFIVIGVVVYFMLRSDRYAFYLKNDEVNIYSGCYYQVELIPKDERYFDYLNYNYSVGDESIATVDEFGRVTAVGVGTTTLKISLSPGFTSKTMRINVENLDVSSIDLRVFRDDKLQAGDIINLKPDQSITLKAVANNRDDLNTTVQYTSSDPTVAFVDSFGNVSAKNAGTAVISGERNGVTGSVTISVKESYASTAIQNIYFASKHITIKQGDKYQLSVNVVPSELKSSTRFTWSSSNPKIVGIDNNGLITGLGLGQSTITAVSSNGLKTTCEVIITNEEIPVEKITLTETNLSMRVDETHQLSATLGPDTASMSSITWSSNNESVATVDQSGIVTGRGVGTAVITVSSGTVKAESKVTVKAKQTVTPKPATAKPATPGSNTSVKVTKVSLGVSNQIEKYVGETLQLSATVEPETITDYSVSWSSSNKNVATVDQHGLITTKKKGTAVITAKVNGVKGSTTVIVREKPGSATAKPATAAPTTTTQAVPKSTFNASYAKVSTQSITVKKGSTQTFKISLYNAAGVFGITSSNANIATVDKATLWLDGADEDSGAPIWAEKTVTVTGKEVGTTYIVINMNDISTYDTVTSLTGQHTIAVTVK